MFFERRDVQYILEKALACFYIIFLPIEFEILLDHLFGQPWQLPIGSYLYKRVKQIVISAEVACVPGRTIQFWNGTGVDLLKSELYVIFCLLLFEGEHGLINISVLPFTTNGILEQALKTAWTHFRRSQILQTRSPRPILNDLLPS